MATGMLMISRLAAAAAPSRANGTGGVARGAGRCCQCQASGSSGLRLELDENPGGIISGEWPNLLSLLSFDDLRAYIESSSAPPVPKVAVPLLRDLMSAPVLTAAAEQTLAEVDHHFRIVSGLPVVDAQLRCVGLLSCKDRARASHGLQTRVGDIMSTPVITLPPHSTIIDAAALMLNRKIHRIPIVDDQNHVIGIITRNGVLQGLDALLHI